MSAIRRAAASCVAVLALSCATGVLAQSRADSYPVKPIRLIVPLAAGGIAGTEIGARSPSDGYTIVLVSNTISINPAIFKKIPYEFDKDLMAVSLLVATPYLLTVHPSLPVNQAVPSIHAMSHALTISRLSHLTAMRVRRKLSREFTPLEIFIL